MAKVKNDPTKYIKRSDLSSSKASSANTKVVRTSWKRDQEFLTAPIDQRFYIDFNRKSFPRQRRS